MITPRMLAYQILLHLEQGLSHPDRLIRGMMERHSGLDPRDKALLTELVYGTLRWQGRLDWHIDRLSSVKPEKIVRPVRVLLRLALYQILFLDRVPDHAAVNESVNIAKGTQPSYVAGFVNGVLREAIRRGSNWDWPDERKSPDENLAVTTSHPLWLARRCRSEMGPEEARRFFEANNSVAPMALRVNPLKGSPSEALARLLEMGVAAEPSPHLPSAIRVSGLRQDLARTSVYQEGLVQIQDEASQLVGHIVSPTPGERVLDLCAGFGGKATHLGALMENRGEILSIDEAAWKIEELRGNARRQSIGIIDGEAAGVLELSAEHRGEFDRVLLDAPCSGLGSVRHNPDIKWRRNLKDPYRFSQIQSALLQHASRFVRKGGVLVYATCTVFREEDEDVAERFNSANPGWAAEPVSPFLPEACRSMAEGVFLRSWPHRHGVDGFFIARWKRVE